MEKPEQKRTFRGLGHARLALAMGALAGLVTAWSAAPPERSVNGVASLLGASIDGEVAPDAFVWEASAGVLADAFLGRSVVFLGAREGALRDVYRARVRVTPSGQPLGVHGAHALTDTPLGDERDLVLRGQRAAFATSSAGLFTRLRSVDLAPTNEPFTAAFCAFFPKQELALARCSAEAFIDVGFDHPSPHLRFELRANALVLSVGAEAVAASLAFADDGPPVLSPGLLGDGIFISREDGSGAPEPAATLATVNREAPDWPPPRAPDIPWNALVLPFVEGAPAPVVTATVDGVRVVAFDLRQLSLGWEPGRLSPPSLTGATGRGSLPAEALVGFVGGQTNWVAGAAAGARMLAPPEPNEPSLQVDELGHVALGPWRETPLENIKFVRQTGPTLFHDGVDEPALDDAEEARSVLGLTARQQLLQASCGACTQANISRVLRELGATQGVEISRGGAPAGVVPASSVRGAAEDYFYVTRREPLAQLPPLADAAWTASEGQKPNPTWLPAIFETKLLRRGEEVRVWALAPERFRFVLSAGTREPRRKEGKDLREGLPEGLSASIIAAFSVGLPRRQGGLSLVVDGIASRPARNDGGAIILSSNGLGLDVIAGSAWAVPEGGSAVELPILAQEATLRRETRRIGRRQARGAVCKTAAGWLFLAQAQADSNEPNATTLLELGCRTVLSLDRESGRLAVFERRTTAEEPFIPREISMMYLLDGDPATAPPGAPP